MKNIYDNLKEYYEKELKSDTEKLYDMGFNKNELQFIKMILDFSIRPMFKKNDNPIDYNDGEKSFSNGYSNGLYDGAFHQAKHMSYEIIDKILIDKFKENNINMEELNLLIKYWWIENMIFNIFLAKYDINIALEFKTGYYIFIQKDEEDNEYDYTLVDYDNIYNPEIIENYKPNENELKNINEYFNSLKK